MLNGIWKNRKFGSESKSEHSFLQDVFKIKSVIDLQNSQRCVYCIKDNAKRHVELQSNYNHEKDKSVGGRQWMV